MENFCWIGAGSVGSFCNIRCPLTMSQVDYGRFGARLGRGGFEAFGGHFRFEGSIWTGRIGRWEKGCGVDLVDLTGEIFWGLGVTVNRPIGDSVRNSRKS